MRLPILTASIATVIFTAGFAIGRLATTQRIPESKSQIASAFEDVWKYEPKTIWLDGGPEDTRTIEEKITALQDEVSAIRRYIIAIERQRP